MAQQTFDPFAVRDETHCGDCDKVLTSATEGKVEDAYIYNGVRCHKCYVAFVIEKAKGCFILPVVEE